MNLVIPVFVDDVYCSCYITHIRLGKSHNGEVLLTFWVAHMASINDSISNYRIIGELAIGGFGSVYQAEHTLLPNRLVAIKLVHATHLKSQQERDRFLQEAKLLEMLKHSHILPFIDVGIHRNFPYLVTEYAPP